MPTARRSLFAQVGRGVPTESVRFSFQPSAVSFQPRTDSSEIWLPASGFWLLRRSAARAFTLAEVLAALMLMAIVIPVALQGVSIASRAGTLGQRKTAAARIADRVLNELVATGQLTQGTASGTISENGFTYPWSLQTDTWTEDTMTVATVHVSFTVQNSTYEVAVSTLYDPNAGSAASASSNSSSSSSSSP